MRSGQPERAVALCLGFPDQVRAPGLGAAAGAGDPDEVAATWHLDQNGAAGEGLPGGSQGQAGQPRHHGALVLGEFLVVGGRLDPRRGGAQRLAIGAKRARPAGRDQLRQLGGAGEAADQGGRARAVGAQGEDLPRVGIRGMGLGVQVVAVVPEHHQAEVPHRREHRGPGARDDQGLAAQGREPATVSLRGAELGGERDVAGRPGGRARGRHQRGQGLVDAGQVARVGDHDDGATAGARGGDGGPSDLLRPGRSGKRGPGRAGRAARGERVQERRSSRVPGPGARIRARERSRCLLLLGGAFRLRPFRGGVALRYGQPEHVREGARVAVGDGAGQAGDLLGQHLLGGYHSLQVAEAALVLAVGGPLDEEAVGQLAREPDPDPDARPRLVREPFRHEVVKRAVEVRKRQVHRDPGDGMVGRGPQGPRVLRLPGPAGWLVGFFVFYGSFGD